MPKFDAGTAVEVLEYDFSTLPNAPAILADSKLTQIPEPTQQQLEAWGEWLISSTGAATQEEAVAKVLAMTPEERHEKNEETKVALAAVCSDSPSKAMLDALPGRVLTRFFGYVAGGLGADPTQWTAGTSTSPVAQTNGAHA